MSERSILITGCSSGIGLASAREMKARGWRVFATARKPEDIARLKDEVGVESLYLDYAEPGSIAEAAEHVLAATGGKLTALFNNGGYGQPGAVEDLKPDVLRAQFEANVFGWHDLTSRVIPSMREQGEGRIVFCSSVLGLLAAPYRGAYCASKFAIEALADTLRMELAATGIKIVLIEPGPIASRFVEHALPGLSPPHRSRGLASSGDLPRPHRTDGGGRQPDLQAWAGGGGRQARPGAGEQAAQAPLLRHRADLCCGPIASPPADSRPRRGGCKQLESPAGRWF
jgi:NAD(P)-dependent dehydrogenase (short-subunit alcohol dehydrogenase family)